MPKATSAMPEAARIFGDRAGLVLKSDAHSALAGADALVILTEWQEFRSPDFDQIRASLRNPAIFDGRNLYNPDLMKRFGFSYYGVGRGLS